MALQRLSVAAARPEEKTPSCFRADVLQGKVALITGKGLRGRVWPAAAYRGHGAEWTAAALCAGQVAERVDAWASRRHCCATAVSAPSPVATWSGCRLPQSSWPRAQGSR